MSFMNGERYFPLQRRYWQCPNCGSCIEVSQGKLPTSFGMDCSACGRYFTAYSADVVQYRYMPLAMRLYYLPDRYERASDGDDCMYCAHCNNDVCTVPDCCWGIYDTGKEQMRCRAWEVRRAHLGGTT